MEVVLRILRFKTIDNYDMVLDLIYLYKTKFDPRKKGNQPSGVATRDMRTPLLEFLKGSFFQKSNGGEP